MTILKLHYRSLEQRVAAEFYQGLSKTESANESQKDLQAFFQRLYQALYENPEQFGFKLQEDEYLVEGEEGEKEHKQALMRKMKKSRNVIVAVLELLMHIGVHGTIEDNKLTMPKDEDLAKAFRSRNQKKFLVGMAELGFHLTDDGESVTFTSEAAPNLLPALQSLARTCSEHENAHAGFFNFRCCDFKALDTANYLPPVEDLFTLFSHEDILRVQQLHEYFTDAGYEPTVTIGNTEWNIQYQGDRKVKSTPLYQLTHSIRYQNPLRVYIKPASTGRLKDLIPTQSTALQTDFSNRAYPCRGDECGWCYDKKSLGPARVSFNGEERVVCWYTNPMVVPFTDESIPLIQEYEQMHAKLIG